MSQVTRTLLLRKAYILKSTPYNDLLQRMYLGTDFQEFSPHVTRLLILPRTPLLSIIAPDSLSPSLSHSHTHTESLSRARALSLSISFSLSRSLSLLVGKPLLFAGSIMENNIKTT